MSNIGKPINFFLYLTQVYYILVKFWLSWSWKYFNPKHGPYFYLSLHFVRLYIQWTITTYACTTTYMTSKNLWYNVGGNLRRIVNMDWDFYSYIKHVTASSRVIEHSELRQGGKKEASSVVEYALPSRGMKAIEKKSLLFVESKSSIVVWTLGKGNKKTSFASIWKRPYKDTGDWSKKMTHQPWKRAIIKKITIFIQPSWYLVKMTNLSYLLMSR